MPAHVFSRHHRKVKLLFALADVVIVALAFAAAYESREWLPLAREFYFLPPVKTLLLGGCALAWPMLGY